MEALALQSPIDATAAESVPLTDVARAAAGDALAFEAVYRTHLPRVHSLLAVLDEPTPQMRRLRALLTDERGRYPSRRTWERRLAAIPDTLPAQIGLLGRALVWLLDPWRDCGRAAAIDSTVLRARGGVWANNAACRTPSAAIEHTNELRMIRTSEPWSPRTLEPENEHAGLEHSEC